MAALIGFGCLVGLVILRDAIVQQFGDVAVALDHADQSFSYTIQINNDGIPGFDVTLASSYTDPGTPLTDAAGSPPACLDLTNAATRSRKEVPCRLRQEIFLRARKRKLDCEVW